VKKTIIIAALAALLAGAVGAYAGTSHIVGRDGPQVALSEACTRLVVAAPGETLEMSVNVIGQQVHCLIRRPDAFARCVRHLPSPLLPVGKFDHGAGKPGDWTNVDSLYRAIVGVEGCSHARLSTTVPQ
jgi:hypothetical protein